MGESHSSVLTNKLEKKNRLNYSCFSVCGIRPYHFLLLFYCSSLRFFVGKKVMLVPCSLRRRHQLIQSTVWNQWLKHTTFSTTIERYPAFRNENKKNKNKNKTVKWPEIKLCTDSSKFVIRRHWAKDSHLNEATGLFFLWWLLILWHVRDFSNKLFAS